MCFQPQFRVIKGFFVWTGVLEEGVSTSSSVGFVRTTSHKSSNTILFVYLDSQLLSLNSSSLLYLWRVSKRLPVNTQEHRVNVLRRRRSV
jgi:hypothetical protein